MKKNYSKFGTKAIHAGVEPDSATGAIMTPIYQTSTYVQEQLGQHKGYAYSRSGNPTRNTLENAIAELENAKYGVCFGSGMAAIDAVMKLLKPGDEVITSNDLYGGSYRIFTGIYANFGINFHFIDMSDLSIVREKINDKTRLIWAETPTNPMMNIHDLEELVKLKNGKEILLAVDNTFATPYLQNPICIGADLVMHSVTKYLGGHSDVVMGAIATTNQSLADEIYRIQNSSGAIPGPMDCFLVLRGLKTLHLRMQRHCENGEQIAEFLAQHPRVKNVYWPGFENHPGHAIAKKQMRNFGGMISFSLKSAGIESTKQVLEQFKLFSLAESLGGVESLVCHPATMTHGSIPEKERQAAGIVDSLIRLSVGVEDIDDLIEDLKQALAQ